MHTFRGLAQVGDFYDTREEATSAEHQTLVERAAATNLTEDFVCTPKIALTETGKGSLQRDYDLKKCRAHLGPKLPIVAAGEAKNALCRFGLFGTLRPLEKLGDKVEIQFSRLCRSLFVPSADGKSTLDLGGSARHVFPGHTRPATLCCPFPAALLPFTLEAEQNRERLEILIGRPERVVVGRSRRVFTSR